MNTHRLIPGMSAQTTALIAFLKDKPVGETLTYEAINAAGRTDVQNGGRGYLTSALRYLARHEGHSWGTVRKVGIKRLNDQENLDLCESEVRRAHRHLGRIHVRASLSDYSLLDEKDKRRHNAVSMATAAGRLLLNKQGMETLRTKLPVPNNASLPDPKDVLEWFRK